METRLSLTKKALRNKELLERGLRYCVTCEEVMDLTKFHRNKRGYHTKCSMCMKAYYEEHGEIIRKRNRESYYRNKYGLSITEVEQLKLMPCNLCGKDSDPVIDHCHRLGVVRGVLCRQCNAALGLLNHDTETLGRAIEYLGRYDEIDF